MGDNANDVGLPGSCGEVTYEHAEYYAKLARRAAAMIDASVADGEAIAATHVIASALATATERLMRDLGHGGPAVPGHEKCIEALKVATADKIVESVKALNDPNHSDEPDEDLVDALARALGGGHKPGRA